MTREDIDFIGGMNMCDEISNEAYRKIMIHCEEEQPYTDAISRQAVLEKSYKITGYDRNSYVVDVADIEALPSVSCTENPNKSEIEQKCDRINSIASVLPYAPHREIQELLCEIMDLCKAESEE